MGLSTNIRPIYFDEVEACVDEIIKRVGKELVVAAPFGIGKPNHLLNSLYTRVKKDKSLHLKIITALNLNRPTWKNDLERRLIEPMVKRLWPDYPDLLYINDLGKLPENFELIQFFFKPGARLNCSHAQQNFLCSNYTHAVRDGVIQGVNVLVQQISKKDINGKRYFSMSSDPDTHLEAGQIMRKMTKEKGVKGILVGQTNQRAPFMYGKALVDEDFYDLVIDNRKYDYEMFHVPKEPVSLTDWTVGLQASTLVKDGGTLQVGIGSLGDAVISGLLLRHENNSEYKNILNDLNVIDENKELIDTYGGTEKFIEGLHISSEMFVDTMIELYKAGIIKRRVYDNITIQRLVNEGKINGEICPGTLRHLMENLAIHQQLTEEDVNFLKEFGIFKQEVQLEGDSLKLGEMEFSNNLGDPANFKEITSNCLGTHLKNGILINTSFFFGPNKFYEYLRSMPEDKLKEINMRGVNEINQLYGNEKLRTLQRRDGRFINAALMVMLNGAIISHTLNNCRVVSGPGGQYNFVSMAHALPDARFLIMVRSTRTDRGKVSSNIVWEYGEITVPRHLIDIVVTEYGIADLRGKTDKQVIIEMLKITDSKFQEKLLKKAKKYKKVPKSYRIPDRYRYNTPEKIQGVLKKYKDKNIITDFPFGTDFTKEELVLGKALKAIAKENIFGKLKLVKGMFSKYSISQEAMPYLERMELDSPKNLKERMMQKIVLYALKNAKAI